MEMMRWTKGNGGRNLQCVGWLRVQYLVGLFVCFVARNGSKVQFPNLVRMACMRDATVHDLLSFGMRVSLSRILPWQEAQMIGKRKTFSVYYLYLQIWMSMFMLREKISLFGLLNPRGPSLLRVYVRGCLDLMILSFWWGQFESPKLLRKLVSLLRRHPRARFLRWSCLKEENSI